MAKAQDAGGPVQAAAANEPETKPQGPGLLLPDTSLSAGVAGSMTVMISNTVGLLFALPLGWVALGVSMMFAALLNVGRVPPWQRAIYFALNSLIIFAVSFGANNLGQGVSGAVVSDAGQGWSIVGRAHAQSVPELRSKEELAAYIDQVVRDSSLSEQQKLSLIQEATAKASAYDAGANDVAASFFKSWKS